MYDDSRPIERKPYFIRPKNAATIGAIGVTPDREIRVEVGEGPCGLFVWLTPYARDDTGRFVTRGRSIFIRRHEAVQMIEHLRKAVAVLPPTSRPKAVDTDLPTR